MRNDMLRYFQFTKYLLFSAKIEGRGRILNAGFTILKEKVQANTGV